MVRKKRKQFHKFEFDRPEQAIQEDGSGSIAAPHLGADEDVLRIHGLGKFESSSDSDSGKSEFDEEYYKHRPDPIPIDPRKVVVIDKENRPQQKGKRVTPNTSYSSIVKSENPGNQSEGKNTDLLQELKDNLVFINTNFPPLDENAASKAKAAKPSYSTVNRDRRKSGSQSVLANATAISKDTSTYINSNVLLNDSELAPFKVPASSGVRPRLKYEVLNENAASKTKPSYSSVNRNTMKSMKSEFNTSKTLATTGVNSQNKIVDADFYSLVGTSAVSKAQRSRNLPAKRGNDFHSNPAKRSPSSVDAKGDLVANTENSSLFNISEQISNAYVAPPASLGVPSINCEVKPPGVASRSSLRNKIPNVGQSTLDNKHPSQVEAMIADWLEVQRSSALNFRSNSPNLVSPVLTNPSPRQLGRMYSDRLDSLASVSTARSSILRNNEQHNRAGNGRNASRPIVEVVPRVVTTEPISRQDSVENNQANRDSTQCLMSEEKGCRTYKYLRYICCVC